MLTGLKHSEEDSNLLLELGNGNGGAFQILYEKYWSAVLDEAFKRLNDVDQAKDVVQEVFACLWAKADKHEIRNLPAWLTTVTKNQVFTAFRKQERFVPLTEIFTELEGFGNNPDANLLRTELARTYDALINSLPGQQRVIFNMRYRDDLTPDEIAAKLNISPKTVRNHLGRALSRLKSAFLILNIILLISEK